MESDGACSRIGFEGTERWIGNVDHFQADSTGASGRDQSSQVGSLGQVVTNALAAKSEVAVAQLDREEFGRRGGGADGEVLEAQVLSLWNGNESTFIPGFLGASTRSAIRAMNMCRIGLTR